MPRQVFRSAKYGGNQNITGSANFSDGTATTTSHNNLSTTTYRKTVRRRREVAQTLQRLPADDRLRSPHPVTRTHPTDAGGPGASGLSLADALRRGPRRRLRRPYCNLALCKLASEITGLNVKSPTGSERTAPRRRLLLLLRGYLAFRGSLFLRGGLRLCLLHHTALLAKSSGGVASAPTRIVGTASRLLQRSKKNIFHIKEPCMERVRARRRRSASRLARRCCCVHPRRRLHHANSICKITETPVKRSLLRCANLDPQSHARPLDSIHGGTCIVQNRCWEHRIGRQKKLHKSFRKRRFGGRASANRANRHHRFAKSAIDVAPQASIHASRGR